MVRPIKQILFFAPLIAFIQISIAQEDLSEFSCDEIESLIDLVASGPNAVVEEVSDDPEYFVLETISGWKCAPEPLSMTRNSRNYIKAIECYVSNDKTPVTSSDFKAAGLEFQKYFLEMVSCLGDSAVSETPKTYDRSSTSRGEGFIFLLDRYVRNNALSLEYGYFQDDESPIIWGIEVFYSTVSRATIENATNN